jgi:polyisoprenoid-binding protein YceI
VAQVSQATSGPDLGAAMAAGTFAGSWTLDPSRSSVGLKTKAMWGIVPVKGSFSEVTGSGAVGDDGKLTGQLTVKSTSVNTKMKKRDEHLRSDDFFACEQFPDITFDVEQATPSPTGLSVVGRLTVRGVTKPLSLPATVTNLGSNEVSIDAVAEIDRSSFGIDYHGKGATKMANVLNIHAVFTRD